MSAASEPIKIEHNPFQTLVAFGYNRASGNKVYAGITRLIVVKNIAHLAFEPLRTPEASIQTIVDKYIKANNSEDNLIFNFFFQALPFESTIFPMVTRVTVDYTLPSECLELGDKIELKNDWVYLIHIIGMVCKELFPQLISAQSNLNIHCGSNHYHADGYFDLRSSYNADENPFNLSPK